LSADNADIAVSPHRRLLSFQIPLVSGVPGGVGGVGGVGVAGAPFPDYLPPHA